MAPHGPPWCDGGVSEILEFPAAAVGPRLPGWSCTYHLHKLRSLRHATFGLCGLYVWMYTPRCQNNRLLSTTCPHARTQLTWQGLHQVPVPVDPLRRADDREKGPPSSNPERPPDHTRLAARPKTSVQAWELGESGGGAIIVAGQQQQQRQEEGGPPAEVLRDDDGLAPRRPIGVHAALGALPPLPPPVHHPLRHRRRRPHCERAPIPFANPARWRRLRAHQRQGDRGARAISVWAGGRGGVVDRVSGRRLRGDVAGGRCWWNRRRLQRRRRWKRWNGPTAVAGEVFEIRPEPCVEGVVFCRKARCSCPSHLCTRRGRRLPRGDVRVLMFADFRDKRIRGTRVAGRLWSALASTHVADRRLLNRFSLLSLLS